MNKKEVISNKQGIALIALFIMGEASIFVQGISANRDIWIAMLLAIAGAVPIIIVFARLHVLFPNKNIFDMMEACFGKVLGRVFIIIFTWYAFHELSTLVEDLGFFMKTVIFSETLFWVGISVFAAISAYMAKQGVEVFARWGELFLIVPILLEIIVLVLLIPKMDFENFLPLAYDGEKPILEGAFLIMGFPLIYIGAFTMIFKLSPRKNSPYKIYLGGFLVGSILLFMIYIIVILVLGGSLAEAFYYPTYVMVSRISIGNFVQRLDIMAAIIYLIGIYVQANVFLLGACQGMSKLFECDDYKFIVLPITLLMLNLASYESDSIMAFFEFAIDAWPYYILPFEVIIPLMIWLTAEIKTKKLRENMMTSKQIV